MSLGRVIRGSFWLYVSGIASTFLAFIYWLLASKFVPPSTVGLAGSVIGMVSIITSIFTLGLNSGATRLFGQAWGNKDRQSLSRYFASSIALNVTVNVVVAILILFLGTVLGLSQLEIPYMTVLIVLGALPPIPIALFCSTLRTGAIALSTIISSLLRLCVGIALVYLGTDFFGIMMGYIIAGVAQPAILFAMIRGIVFTSRPAFQPAKEALKMGIPSWIPSIVSTAGMWLGVISVNEITGSAQAGTYLMAFNMSMIAYTLPLSLLGLMFPVLSGMGDGRKRATSSAIRLTLALMAPLAAIVIAYPYVPLSLFGSSYIASSLALQILMLGCFAAPISAGFSSLVYAYGKYSYVTILGLTTNIPQLALYFVLVAIWGNNGAALSYIAGQFIVLVAVFFMARCISYKVGWGSALIFAAIPSVTALLMSLTGLFWVFGTLVILAVSFFAYARLGLVKRSDIVDVTSAFLSRKQLDSVYPYVKYILKTLYEE